MLYTVASSVFHLPSPAGKRLNLAAVYVTIAAVTMLAALLSTFQIHHRLQQSHLIEAHYSRMIENLNKVAVPRHYPVFVAATSTGKIEFVGKSICNCENYQLGERVKLWLDPAERSVVTPNRLLDVWFFPFLMVIAAAGFSVFALAVQKPQKPH